MKKSIKSLDNTKESFIKLGEMAGITSKDMANRFKILNEKFQLFRGFDKNEIAILKVIRISK